ncbi:hypothetical protein EVAR_59562_1 [Eumeta japonica]|uniref:Uncharacterized protein n=1 Tax=Eumeta variegata TaxID=151549 RepID=A0A4C1YV24_EUMVA|nr:hypothetical protein EVAR_59562_1 [Eumeta japonica]
MRKECKVTKQTTRQVNFDSVSEGSRLSNIRTTFPPFATIVYIMNLTPLISLIMLSMTCERFDCSVKRVQSACVEMLDDPNCQNSTRRLAKNVLRLCGARYRKMRACGLFAVDADLPLRMVELITAYCIVLLQFAF